MKRSAAAFCALMLAACHRTSPAAQDAIIHGNVLVIGTAFEQRLVLVTRTGRRTLHAAPADSAALVRVAGPDIELSVRALDAGGALAVHAFTVQTVSGNPVVDGVLRGEPDRLSIETATGLIALGNPPPALRGMIGARVWIQGPLDHGPNAYGVIVPR
jgi:hypothetical protein